MDVAERKRIADRIVAITEHLRVLYRAREEHRRSAAQDRARARPAAVVAADTDIDVEIDAPRMQDVLRGYTRLP